MKRTYFLFLKTALLLLFPLGLFAQNVILSGYVYDSNNGESLQDVIIIADEDVVFTNELGYFSIEKEKGKEVCLDVRHVGYILNNQCFTPSRDSVFKIALTANNTLEEVVVSDSRFSNQLHAPSGKINISIEKMKLIPAIGGEQDLLKYLSILPGVSGGFEGFSQISVRGGEPYENQFYVDGVPVYNTGYLLGFNYFKDYEKTK